MPSSLCHRNFNSSFLGRVFFFQYLGCVEVYESRGMQVCEEALKVLRVSLLKKGMTSHGASPNHFDLLKNSRRRPVKGVLHISGDGLRVVEEETKVNRINCCHLKSVLTFPLCSPFKGLIVDQTIEKVSFCAPDRNHEKGFSYICRDGTTRRWMCHGFLASKDSVRCGSSPSSS